jgi:hypothetical protein
MLNVWVLPLQCSLGSTFAVFAGFYRCSVRYPFLDVRVLRTLNWEGRNVLWDDAGQDKTTVLLSEINTI